MTATDCTNSSSSRSREWWSCIVHDTSRTSSYPPWVPQDIGGSKAPAVIVELKVSFVFLCVSVSVCLLTVVIRATTTNTVLCIQSLLTLWAMNWMLISSVVKSLPRIMLPTYMCRDMLKWNKSSFLQKLVAAWMRILLTFFISNVSWVLANITSESSHCFQKGNRNSGRRLCIVVCPSFWEDYYMLIYTHCWELMNSVGSHGSLSLPFVMKVMVCHFVSDSHEVMTALIVVLPLIVVVEIPLQLHQSYMFNLLHVFLVQFL